MSKIGMYQLKPLACVAVLLLLTPLAEGTKLSEASFDAADLVGSESETLTPVNIGNVIVYGELTDLVGMNAGVGQDIVGKSTLNQAQIDLIQASNMASVLDKIPGVSMSGSPRPGGQTINIRGMSESKNVPITVDGALKTFDKYRQGSLYVDPDLIKQVTVQKGAFNPEVGNSGFGGSVQLKTKDATDFLKKDQQIGAYLKYGFHTNNRQNNYAGAVYAQSKNEKIDSLLYVTQTNSQDIKLAEGDRYRGSSMDQKSYLFKTNLHLFEESKLTLTYANTHFKGWMPFAAMGGNTITTDPNNDYDWKRRIFYRDQRDQNYGVNFEYDPTDNPWVNFKADITHSITKQHDVKIKPREGEKAPSITLSTFGEENWTTYKNTNIHLRNSSIFTMGEMTHTLTIGAQYLRKQQDALMFYNKLSYGTEAFNFGLFTPPFLPAGRQTVASIYINDDIQLGNLTISPSLRYDHVRNQSFGNVAGYSSIEPQDGHDYRPVSYRGLSPKLSLYWQPNDHWALFSDYAYSWQSPSIDEQYTVQGKGTNGPNGTSRYLGKEKLRAFRIGGLLNFYDLIQEDDQLSLQVTAFHNRVNHEVIRKIGAIYCEAHKMTGSGASCGKPMGTFHNGPGYTIQGIELEAKYDSEYLFGSLSASMMKGERKGSPRDLWFEKDTWMRDIPPREISATLGFNIPNINLSAGWHGKFVRKQDRSPFNDDPKAGALSYKLTHGYAVHGLFMSYAPSGIHGPQINLTIDNLFNKAYAPYLNDGVEAPGRDIRLSVSYQF